MNLVYLQLGSNSGDRLLNFRKTLDLIEIKLGKVIRASGIYESEAWGMKNQPYFLNSVVLIETILTPFDLLDGIIKIEKKLKRVKNIKWGPRIIDIDILFFNSDVISQPDLEIPHPFISQRRFVLLPLCEIAPQYVHPVLKKKVNELLTQCEDETKVWTFHSNG
jgi:2-amino-4-hydroxy-6-hydroxymethyldihydropteridine diphosphokinase